jgi:hypothetical protein
LFSFMLDSPVCSPPYNCAYGLIIEKIVIKKPKFYRWIVRLIKVSHHILLQ